MYTQAVHRAEALRPWCVVHWQKHWCWELAARAGHFNRV